MIRSSEFGSLEPTRQVTAQRYQASVTPGPQEKTGLEKLADFGMGVLKYKHQVDQEVLQADLSMATEKYEDAIKSMDPEDFAKDPDAALKAAGIEDMYALLDKAPPGRQAELRKKIDYLRDSTTTSMTTAANQKAKLRATVYNTSNELRTTGDVSEDHWSMVMSLPKEAQKHAIASLAQIAITEGHVALFDRMYQDKRLSPDLHDNVESWKRQATDRIESKKREAEMEARRRAKEAEKANKAALKVQAQNAAIGMLASGFPIDYVMALPHINSGVKRDELEGFIMSNPALHQQVAVHSVLNADKAMFKAGLANPLAPDGKSPAPHFIYAMNTLHGYKKARGGWDGLEGIGVTEKQRQMLEAAELTRSPDEDFTSSMFRVMTTAPKHTAPVDTKEIRERDRAAMEGLNLSQQDQYWREVQALTLYGVPHERASEKALEKVTADTFDAGGVTVTGASQIKNTLGEALGVEADDRVMGEVINTTIDKTLANASSAYFGTNQPLSNWQQFTSLDGTLIFRHIDRPALMVPVTTDQFKRTASEFKQKDVTYGKDEPTRRTEHREMYRSVGAGYPVRTIK